MKEHQSAHAGFSNGSASGFVTKPTQFFTSIASEAGESLFLLNGRRRTWQACAKVSLQLPGMEPCSISLQWELWQVTDSYGLNLSQANLNGFNLLLNFLQPPDSARGNATARLDGWEQSPRWKDIDAWAVKVFRNINLPKQCVLSDAL